MSRKWMLGVAALAGIACSPFAVLAAAPDDIDMAAPAKAKQGLIAPLEYKLDTEMVVKDWVLCISQSFAESIARADSPEQARAVYADLKANKSCGLFPELHVILHQSVYSQSAAQVFSAAVNFSGRWANAYLVQRGVAADR